jgi:sugar O-acyltransferase (sialic acid O-acetyltransferase NeuD family)
MASKLREARRLSRRRTGLTQHDRVLTPKPILLIGAGGFARETLELLRAINSVDKAWNVIGVLDDDRRLHGEEIQGVTVIGPPQAVQDHQKAMVVASVASPQDPLRRLRLVERLGLPAERYATLVHPTAVVPQSASLGPGSVLHAGTILTADVDVGAHVAVMPAVVLTHDVRIDDGATLGAGVSVSGGVVVERGAYIGSGAILREGVVVGAGAIIGMGALVTRSVPEGEVWVGSPAKPIDRTTLLR